MFCFYNQEIKEKIYEFHSQILHEVSTRKAGLQEKERINTGRSSSKQTGNRLKQEAASEFSEVNQRNWE